MKIVIRERCEQPNRGDDIGQLGQPLQDREPLPGVEKTVETT